MDSIQQAFVIMPFDDEIANDTYRLSTKLICEEFGLKVERADEMFTANPIRDDIIIAIEEAAVIIADISGKNANVFYELGMSHMLKRKQTIMITREEYKKVPFDIAHFRIIKYENTIAGKASYEDQLGKTLENILRDYKTIYKNEFEQILKVMLFAEKGDELILLVALSKVTKPLEKNDKLNMEGHYDHEGEKVTIGHSTQAENAVSTFIRLAYVEVSGDLLIVTDKGKAFVELLEEKEFVCDYVNGNILSKGYVPNFINIIETDEYSSEKKSFSKITKGEISVVSQHSG